MLQEDRVAYIGIEDEDVLTLAGNEMSVSEFERGRPLELCQWREIEALQPLSRLETVQCDVMFIKIARTTSICIRQYGHDFGIAHHIDHPVLVRDQDGPQNMASISRVSQIP